MTDALDAMKAKFAAIATAPASTFTSFRGYQPTAAAASGKTAGRFVFFRLGAGVMGARGAGNAADHTEGDIIVVATIPCPSAPTDAEQDMVYDVIAQLDAALGTSRALTSGGRTYAVRPNVDHDDLLVVNRWPFAAGVNYFTLRARFGVFYTGV